MVDISRALKIKSVIAHYVQSPGPDVLGRFASVPLEKRPTREAIRNLQFQVIVLGEAVAELAEAVEELQS